MSWISRALGGLTSDQKLPVVHTKGGEQFPFAPLHLAGLLIAIRIQRRAHYLRAVFSGVKTPAGLSCQIQA